MNEVAAMTTSLAGDYRELVDEVRDCIGQHVPRGAVVLIASKGDDALTRIGGYRAWHFPRDESGVYAGHHPADSSEALVHLRRLYASGARYLVFPWTARWWLEHYTGLATHLESAHVLTVSRDEVCVIYELRDSPAFEAFHIQDDGEELPDADGAAPAAATRLSVAAPAARSPLRVLSILARFGTEQYPHAEAEIDEIFRRQMPAVQRTSVIVDNALPGTVHEAQHGALLLGGDNGAREFSAFERALDVMGSEIWSYDLVHFATSAFNTLYVAYLERFDTRLLEAIAGRAVCVGHIDCYNDPVEILTYHTQHWIRSCFFMLPPAEVRLLGRFVSVRDNVRWFSGQPEEPFRADAPISPRYREYITQWLTRGEIGQGVEWHSRFALSRDTLPAFEEKTRAILNEQLLGIRLRALGCPLVDVTWLSARLRHLSPQEIAWTTPWREQLAHRDRDALSIGDPRLEHVGIAV
jgi:hypothetical protein